MAQGRRRSGKKTANKAGSGTKRRTQAKHPSIKKVTAPPRRQAEARRAEKVLKASRDFRWQLFDELPLPIWAAGADAKCNYFNKSWLTFTGRKAEQELGDGWSEGVHPDDRTRCFDTYLQAFRVRVPFEMEYRLRRHDGEYRWILDTGRPFYDHGGSFTGYIGSCLDITMRKQVEEAEAQRVERLRAQQAALVELAKNKAIHGGELAKAFRAITEIAAQTMLVGRASVWLHDEGRSAIRLMDLYEPALGRHTDGTVLFAKDYPAYFREIETEERAIAAQDAHADPRTREFAASYLTPIGIGAMLDAPIRLKGRVVGVLCHEHLGGARTWTPEEQNFAGSLATMVTLALDAHEHRRAEEALRRAEEKYRSIFENAVEGIFQTTSDGRYISANPALARIYGYQSPPEMIEAVTDIRRQIYVNPGRRSEFMRMLEAHDAVTGFEAQVYRKDGSMIWVSESARAVRDPQGALLCYEGTVEDITERKQLEQQLLQSQKMEAIGRLAGGVAHDFNNLLTAIMGYSQLLLSGAGAEESRRRNAEQIKQAAERAAALTSQLLAFSRRQVLTMRVLDLNGIVAALEPMLRRVIGEDITLVTILDRALERTQADVGQIEQVIMNLVVNARDAMPRGGTLTIGTANVELGQAYVDRHGLVPPGAYVQLTVSDTGCGMDMETQAHIFEPFFTTKEHGRGTGLGLSTVYGVIKQSGGHIWVYSEPSEGTTFKIYLPRVEGAVQTIEHRAVSVESPRGTETVLLAEDDEGVRELAGGVLAQSGYTVLAACGGEEALLLNERHAGAIHLLVTDVVMPGISGRELAERLVPLRPNIKILYISGYTDDAVVRHGVLAEEVAYLQKPFTPTGLLLKVRKVLG